MTAKELIARIKEIDEVLAHATKKEREGMRKLIREREGLETRLRKNYPTAT